MKTIVTFVFAGAVVLGAAPPAAAFKLAPPSTMFSGSGPVTFSSPAGAYECKLSIRGATSATGLGKITAAVFTPGASACANTAASGLPWKVRAINATTARIINLTINTTFGACGPATIHVAINGGGLWSINTPVPPACATLSASIPTAPPITIVP
jgi:hypothetical protein